MSEDNTENNSKIEEEKTKARDTPRHGSHFSQQPESKYEEQEEEEQPKE